MSTANIYRFVGAISMIAAFGCYAAAMFVDDRPDVDAVVIPEQIDLGPVKVGTVKQCTAKIRNGGRSAVSISKVWSSCGCTVAKVAEQAISVGADTEFVANVTATKSEQPIVTRYVYIEVANGEGTQKQVLAVPIRYSNEAEVDATLGAVK